MDKPVADAEDIYVFTKRWLILIHSAAVVKLYESVNQVDI